MIIGNYLKPTILRRLTNSWINPQTISRTYKILSNSYQEHAGHHTKAYQPCLRYLSLKFMMMLGKFVTIHKFCECSISVILHTVKRVILYNFQTFLIQSTFVISELPLPELIFY